MTIPAIGAISSALGAPSSTTLSSLLPASNASVDAAGASGTASAGGASGGDFASMLSKGLDAVQSAQSNADSLAVQAATGDLTDIHAYTIAATQASLMTELATAIRTKGVDAFNQIMGMQA